MKNPAQPRLSTIAHRIWRGIEIGGRKPNVLRGLAPKGAAGDVLFELFLRGMVRWNGKTSARVLERKP